MLEKPISERRISNRCNSVWISISLRKKLINGLVELTFNEKTHKLTIINGIDVLTIKFESQFTNIATLVALPLAADGNNSAVMTHGTSKKE
jgi:hypothetical protein